MKDLQAMQQANQMLSNPGAEHMPVDLIQLLELLQAPRFPSQRYHSTHHHGTTQLSFVSQHTQGTGKQSNPVYRTSM